MTHDDEVCLKLGREVVRMIHEVRKATGEDVGYSRRTFTFPGGEVVLLILKDKALADVADAAISGKYKVETVKPPSEVN